jgi:hypothetical protein
MGDNRALVMKNNLFTRLQYFAHECLHIGESIFILIVASMGAMII